MDLLTENSVSEELLSAVQKMRQTEKTRMGRDYASAHEAWARLTELNEQAKKEAKSADELLKDLWGAVKERNEDEIHVELRQLGNAMIGVCMTYALMAAEAHRAAEEL